MHMHIAIVATGPTARAETINIDLLGNWLTQLQVQLSVNELIKLTRFVAGPWLSRSLAQPLKVIGRPRPQISGDAGNTFHLLL